MANKLDKKKPLSEAVSTELKQVKDAVKNKEWYKKLKKKLFNK